MVAIINLMILCNEKNNNTLMTKQHPRNSITSFMSIIRLMHQNKLKSLSSIDDSCRGLVKSKESKIYSLIDRLASSCSDSSRFNSQNHYQTKAWQQDGRWFCNRFYTNFFTEKVIEWNIDCGFNSVWRLIFEAATSTSAKLQNGRYKLDFVLCRFSFDKI